MQAPSRLICAALRRTDRLDEAFSPAGQGVILLDDDGRMETMTAQAAQWLTLYFPGWAGGNRLPEQLQRWRQGQSRPNDRAARAPLANEPLVVPLEHHRLVVRLGDDPARKLLLLTEAQPTSSPELLETLGLTRREAEVLHWVAEGKSNPEIAIILAMTRRAVEKHLEHVFAKLGVENRTAALLCVVDKLGAALI